MLGKKLIDVLSIWENSNKTLLNLKNEFDLTNLDLIKLRDHIRNSKSLHVRHKK